MENKKRKYREHINKVLVKDSVSLSNSYLYNLLKKPVITEKTTFISELGKLVFDVDVGVSKKDIAERVLISARLGISGGSCVYKGINVNF